MGIKIYFIIILLVLIGTFNFLIKCLLGLVSEKKEKKNLQFFKAKMCSIIMMMFFEAFLLIFLSLITFFPKYSYNLPISIKLIGMISFFLFWGCFAGIAMGLKHVVQAGHGSSVKLLRELFDMIKKN